MITTHYTNSFLKQFKKLPKPLQEEAFDKIDLFTQDPHHSFLKTHKLQGRLADRWSFSVNYKTRIVFQFLDTENAVFLAIGDHDVYKV